MPTPQTGQGNGSFEDFLARYLQGQSGTQDGHPIDISQLLGQRTREVLALASQFATGRGEDVVDSLHILHVMATTAPASEMIERTGTAPGTIVAAVEAQLPVAQDSIAETPNLTAAAQQTLLQALQVARASGATFIEPEHLFFALLVNPRTQTGQILAAAGVTPDALQSTGAATRAAQQGPGAAEAGISDAPGSSKTPTLDKYSTDLTARARDGKLDPVIGRDDEIEQTIEILSRRTKNNPVLIGEAGVGKTAIVEGLAEEIIDGRVPQALRGKRVLSLDLASMVGGTRYRGDFEERLTKLLDEISSHRDELIVFIDELHTVVGAGSGNDGGMDAGNILKPRLARGELHIIGATTLKEYRRIEKDSALERRFQPVHVGEPRVEDAIHILDGLKDTYERHHGVRYTDAAVRAAVELSSRYITDRFLPDKAIDLIDQAGARLRLKLGDQDDTSALTVRIAKLETEKDDAISAEYYEDASKLRDEIETARAELAKLQSGKTADARAVVDEPQIADVLSRATGIPVARITEIDKQRLADLESELHKRVIGQNDAVELVARAVRRNRTGMGDPHRPIGSFLFLGPTGVGKTELAKALAESLFGDDNAMLRFDMSEYGERHTASRLVGAPPGYVGYDEAGQLTERVRRNPYSVVLFDEIEKAHPDVFNLLLQVLDDGRLTDGQGRTVDFRNTVIIMTSNLGSEFLASRSGALGFVADTDGSGSGFGSEQELRSRVMGKLREAMRPEFLNRIDEIVLFRKLTKAQLRQITDLLLSATRTRLQQQGIELDVDDAALTWIAERGYEPEFGARPLRRVIQRELDNRIADLIVADQVHSGDTLHVTVADGTLHVGAALSQPVPLAAMQA